jgi:Transposase IS66 family
LCGILNTFKPGRDNGRTSSRPELLMVLDRPEIPLHTNRSENDIRAQVTRRKVSGGTRSDVGRDCRDGFSGLAKTCFNWALDSGITSAYR